MKELNGRELAGFIKERQAKQVRSLRQSKHVEPKLAIIQCKDDPIIDTYVRLKKKYGSDIGVDVEIHKPSITALKETIVDLNNDESVHGIIIQLPLPSQEDESTYLNIVAPEKDVDGLGEITEIDPATPTAILWLLAGYNIDLNGKTVAIAGQGRLVGAPLKRILEASGVAVVVADKKTENLKDVMLSGQVIIAATGTANLISSEMIAPNSVVVDAGVAVEDGVAVGDLADDVYERSDLKITPRKGGVGPLTVCALFENVLRAAANQA